ncbi:unnamed protein product, partial [Amoebophrya sp. A25]
GKDNDTAKRKQHLHPLQLLGKTRTTSENEINRKKDQQTFDSFTSENEMNIVKEDQQTSSSTASEDVVKLCRPYRITMMVHARGEGENIKRWLDFHIAAGVDHFAIYLNEGREDVERQTNGFLAEYVKKNVVEVFP